MAINKISPPGMLPGLQPLGADVSTQGLRPISVTEGGGPPMRRDVDIVAQGNPVDEFLAEHPEENESAVPTDVPDPVEPPPEAAPPVEGGAEPVDADGGVPPEAKPSAEAKPATAPETAPAAEAPQATAERAPSKPTYAADDKFALGANADGTPVEWTRGQLVEALKERVTLQPLAQEAEKWRGLFNGDYAKAESDWKPLLATLRENPHLTQLFDNVLHDEGLADYLQRSAIHFENERMAGNVPARQAQQQVPDLATEVAQLKAQVAAQKAFADEALRKERLAEANRQISDAIAQYPFLGTDRAALQALIHTADYLQSQNPAWGMKEALAANRSMYEAVTRASNVLRQEATPATPEPPVPALLGSGGGASPSGSRPVDTGRAKKFNDVQEGVDDWLRMHPQ